MKKNLLFTALAATTLLFATSCQQDEVFVDGNEATVTFEVGTPQMATRAYSDGLSAKNLQWAVYNEDDTDSPVIRAGQQLSGETTLVNGKASVNITLAAGKNYNVLFWAEAENAPYNVDFETKKLSVVYDNATSNDESRDAFYCYKPVQVEKANKTETVVLRRPFAQLNIGTNDLNKLDGVSAEYTQVTVPVYSTLNLATGIVEGTATKQTFAFAARPASETFPVADYDYLAMNYLLVGKDKAVVDVTFSYDAAANATAKPEYTRTYTGIPVQANYRTNIYGSLLTQGIDFEVEINPDFNGNQGQGVPYVTLRDANNNHKDNYATLADALEATDATYNTLVLNGSVDIESTTIEAGKTIIIDLNGNSIQGIDETNKNFGLFQNNGNLTIVGEGAIYTKATINSGWNRYSAVISNNPGATLTIGEGVTIEHRGGTDMAYGIDNLTNGTIGDVNATISGTVKSTYRAVRQFLNSDSKENNLTIKSGAVIEGENNGVFFHDPSQKANNGKIVVENGANVNGVYLFVTAGSTEWPVEVSIADASIGEKGVTYKNVPANYAVVNKDGVWTVESVSITNLATTNDELKALLDDDNISEIYLAAGTTFEGTFTVEKAVTIKSINPADKATIKGRVNVSSDGDGASFENIKFDINDESKVKNAFTGTNYQYPAIVVINAAATSFEGCEFKSDITTGVCSINYGSHAAGKKLNINNCSFEGDFYAIRSRTLFSITNSTFDTYTPEGLLAAVFTWGNGESGTKGDSGANSITFKGNTNLNANKIRSTQLSSTTFNYCHINVDVQGNTNFLELKDCVNPACDFSGTTFKPGSETFEFQSIEMNGTYYTTMQAAVNSASNGATINVSNATYDVNSLDIKNKTINFIANSGATIKGLVYMTDSNVKFKGFTFTNPEAKKTTPDNVGDLVDQKVNGMNPCVGVYTGTTVEMEDCNFIIDGDATYGFSSYASTNATFINCYFDCNKKRPIATNGAKTTVTGCTFNNQYHYSLRIFENAEQAQTVEYTNNTIIGSNDKGEFEGINISKKGGTATILGSFTIKGNTAGLKYRHHANVNMSTNCTYDTDITNFAFEREQ